MPNKLDIHSEINPLELVVTSPPGLEFELMIPENLERHHRAPDGSVTPSADYLLFDDLVLLSAMQAEHRQLVKAVTAMTGPAGHLPWRQLLIETLARSDARREAIDGALKIEFDLYHQSAAERDAVRAALDRLDGASLAHALMTGRDPIDGHVIFRWPAPNALFARDLAAVCGDGVILTYAAEPARKREMMLSRAVFRHHPRFCGVDVIDIGDDGRPVGGLAIEGGDIQVLSDKVVLVGVGIRTSLASVRRLATMLFARGFETVLGYEMPRRRAAMHIDTLFTRIDEGHCLIYPPLILDPAAAGAHVHRITLDGVEDGGDDLLAALAVDGIELDPVFCGGSDPVAQAREQWSDGANAFALAPGIIVSYGRNERTLRELNTIGYRVLSPAAFADNALYHLGQGHRVVIALQGHELVRGRGGPRCLTMPLRRRV